MNEEDPRVKVFASFVRTDVYSPIKKIFLEESKMVVFKKEKEVIRLILSYLDEVEECVLESAASMLSAILARIFSSSIIAVFLSLSSPLIRLNVLAKSVRLI